LPVSSRLAGAADAEIAAQSAQNGHDRLRSMTALARAIRARRLTPPRPHDCRGCRRSLRADEQRALRAARARSWVVASSV
jgi:hypothetical protein